MHVLADQVLMSAVQSLESAPTELDINVKAALKFCEVLQTVSNVEVVIIAIFSKLSRLVSTEERSMRRAAGAVLAKANITGVLEEAQNRCKAAEERARTAEDQVLTLEKEISILRSGIR